MNTNTLATAIRLAEALDAPSTPGAELTEPTGDLVAALLGESVIVRTVTMIYTGGLVALDDRTLVLSNAAWIADTGRWANALATGELSEVEPYPTDDVFVARSSVVDLTRWNHDLPTGTK